MSQDTTASSNKLSIDTAHNDVIVRHFFLHFERNVSRATSTSYNQTTNSMMFKWITIPNVLQHVQVIER